MSLKKITLCIFSSLYVVEAWILTTKLLEIVSIRPVKSNFFSAPLSYIYGSQVAAVFLLMISFCIFVPIIATFFIKTTSLFYKVISSICAITAIAFLIFDKMNILNISIYLSLVVICLITSIVETIKLKQ
ncbi:MAG: hypothetical protein RR229_00990 [Oscillospiraceae bacterium]